jgi:hypothetical protein
MNMVFGGWRHHPPARRPALRSRRSRLITLATASAGLAVLVSACGGSGSGLVPGAIGPSSGGSPGAGATPTGGTGNGNYGLVTPGQEITGMGSRSGITGGALFGGTATLASEEARLGRRLAIVRAYYRIGEHFPANPDRTLMAQGSTLLVSLDTVPGGPTYPAIAAGEQDAAISAFLKSVNQAAVRYHLSSIYVSFEHEMNAPNTHYGLGTPGQFVAAWDHIHQLATAAHLDWNDGGRLHWVFIMTHTGYQPLADRGPWGRSQAGPTTFWPGSNEVDIVAADGYNSDGCKILGQGSSATPQALFSGLIGFARANGGLPVFIAEWGSTPFDPGGGQAEFIHQMESFVSANPEIAAVSYWNNRGARCTFSIDNYPSAILAMATMAHASALQGHLLGL